MPRRRLRPRRGSRSIRGGPRCSSSAPRSACCAWWWIDWRRGVVARCRRRRRDGRVARRPSTSSSARRVACDLRRSAVRLGLRSIGATLAASFLLRSDLRRTNPRPQPGLAAHPAEQTRSGFFDHVELGLVGADAELIQGRFASGLDGLCGGFDPLHVDVLFLLHGDRAPMRPTVRRISSAGSVASTSTTSSAWSCWPAPLVVSASDDPSPPMTGSGGSWGASPACSSAPALRGGGVLRVGFLALRSSRRRHPWRRRPARRDHAWPARRTAAAAVGILLGLLPSGVAGALGLATERLVVAVERPGDVGLLHDAEDRLEDVVDDQGGQEEDLEDRRRTPAGTASASADLPTSSG